MINEELLKSAKLTGIWEGRLRQIERGSYSASEFIAQLKSLISEITLNVLRDTSNRVIETEIKTDSEKEGKGKSKNKN